MSGSEADFFVVALPLLAVWWMLHRGRGKFRPPAEIGREGNPRDRDPHPWAHPPPMPPSRAAGASDHGDAAWLRKLETLCASKFKVGDLVELVELDDYMLQYFSVCHPSAKFWRHTMYEGRMGLVLDVKPNRGLVYDSPGVLVSIWGGKPTWHSPALWRAVCHPENS
jgi:hypothetical protein